MGSTTTNDANKSVNVFNAKPCARSELRVTRSSWFRVSISRVMREAIVVRTPLTER